MIRALPIESERPLDALGNPVRRRIVGMLARAPLSVGEIAAALPVSRPAVSKHLQVLERAALVAHDRSGNRNLFRLDRQGFEAARSWLDGFWDEALSRYALAAENLAVPLRAAPLRAAPPRAAPPRAAPPRAAPPREEGP